MPSPMTRSPSISTRRRRRSRFSAGSAPAAGTPPSVMMRLLTRYFAAAARRAAASGEPAPRSAPRPASTISNGSTPVYPGDTVTSPAGSSSKRESASKPAWGLVTFETTGVNQKGETVFVVTGHVFVAKHHPSLAGPARSRRAMGPSCSDTRRSRLPEAGSDPLPFWMAANHKNLTSWRKRPSRRPSTTPDDYPGPWRSRKREGNMSDRDCFSTDAGDASSPASIVDPSDLLVRLRDAEFDADDMLIRNVKALFKEAADEIERLRRLAGTRPPDRT